MGLQSRKVGMPFFSRLLDKIGIGELVDDISEIGGKRCAGQPFHVFEYKSGWPGFTNNSNSLTPHIAVIGMSTMLSAKREGLTWRTTAYEIDLAFKLTEIDLTNIAFNFFRPLSDKTENLTPILADRIAAPSIPFDDFGRTET